MIISGIYPLNNDISNHFGCRKIGREGALHKFQPPSWQQNDWTTWGSMSGHGGWWCLVDEMGTPLKFNMEPENQPLEKEIPFGNHHFQVPC